MQNFSYLIGNKLITGDTLFVENIGRTDRPMAEPKKMKASLERLKKLDDNIEIYPGHDYGSKKSSTIGYEKKNNYYRMLADTSFKNIYI